MTKTVIVFEDSGWRRLLPLVYLRPVFDLLCGMQNLLERLQICLGASPKYDEFETVLWCRTDIADVVAEQTHLQVNKLNTTPQSDNECTLFLNGRGYWKQIPQADEHPLPWLGTVGDQSQIACLFADADLLRNLAPEVALDEARFLEAVAGVERHDVGECVTLFDWPWQIVLANEQAMLDDWKTSDRFQPGVSCEVGTGVHLLNEQEIHIGSGTGRFGLVKMSAFCRTAMCKDLPASVTDRYCNRGRLFMPVVRSAPYAKSVVKLKPASCRGTPINSMMVFWDTVILDRGSTSLRIA